MNAVLPVAERMLRQYGEFYPYGGCMRLDGSITHIGATDADTDHPKSKAMVFVLKDSLREMASRGECKAVAVVFDVSIALPNASAKSDAIQVNIEHQAATPWECFSRIDSKVANSSMVKLLFSRGTTRFSVRPNDLQSSSLYFNLQRSATALEVVHLCSLAIKIAALSLSVAAMQGSAQSAPGGQSDTQDAQIRDYWIDPSTGLMWAGKDNGKDVSWKKAMKYCRDLRLAGYSDWRLATVGEMEGIYDKNANAAGRAGPGTGRPFTFHVKGNLFLTGNQWTSTRIVDDRGHPSGYAMRFDFNEGRVFNGDELSFRTNKRALCVRGSKK